MITISIPQIFLLQSSWTVVPMLAEEGIPPTDDREDFIPSRLEDKLYHHSSVGGFIPDEEVK